MISSPDLLAFSGAEGFGEKSVYPEDEGLPEELSVPLLPTSHPWVYSTTAQFHRDFILVAEFSEQVGPQPVRTIPDDPKVLGSFDLGHFSVRLMSVDYQASCPAQTPPTATGPRLNFNEDSKVILGDSADSAFAYVHHVTLYDLEARGMVRPFCMAYVSSDQLKLMEHFSELSASFSRASDSLKTGNRRAFATELQRKLRELEHKHFTLQQDAELHRAANETVFLDPEETANSLAAIERSIQDHRQLLRQVTSYPNRKLKQPDFLPYDPADSLADPYSSMSPDLSPSCSPCPSPSSIGSRDFERRLKSLEELSDTYFLSLTMEQLMETERRLRGDRSVLHTDRVTRALTRKLTLTNFLFESWRPEEEAEEEEEKERGIAELQRSPTVDPQSLESFFSCVEEIPIKLEVTGGGVVTPDPEPNMEMAGSVSSDDSIEVLGTEKSYRTQGIISGSDTRELSLGLVEPYTRRVAPEVAVKRVRACTRRANSEDSIEVLSTTESIFPEDLTAITEEEPEYRFLDNGFQDMEEEFIKHRNVVTEEKKMEIHEDGTLEERTGHNEDRVEEESSVDREFIQQLMDNDPHKEQPWQGRATDNEMQEEEKQLKISTMGNEAHKQQEPLKEGIVGNEVHEKEKLLNESSMDNEVHEKEKPLEQSTMGNEVHEKEKPLEQSTMGNEVHEKEKPLEQSTLGNEVHEKEKPLEESTMGNEAHEEKALLMKSTVGNEVDKEMLLKQRTVGNEVHDKDKSVKENTKGNKVHEEEKQLKESIVDNTVHERELLKEGSMGNEVHEEERTLMNNIFDEEEPLKERTVCNEIQEEVNPSQAVVSYTVNEVYEGNRSEDVASPLQVVAGPRWSGGFRRGDKTLRIPEPPVRLAPATALPEVLRWSLSSSPHRLWSVDEASDCTSFTSSSPCTSDAPSLTPSLHGNSRSHLRVQRRRAGTRALRFLQQNSFSEQAVYCLLSGRPLVVIGGDENAVRKLVSALALFVPAPGPHGNSVLPSLATPLQLTDLLTWRLIGIHRSPSTASSSVLHSLARYGRYLALLDLDQKTLRCPSFSGSLVSRLADPHTAICRGNTYLLHLESCLAALTNHALVFTFNPALHHPNASDEAALRRAFLLRQGFCSSEDDLRVLYFLSDLIKQRHVGCGPPVLQFSYSPTQLHRNTISA